MGWALSGPQDRDRAAGAVGQATGLREHRKEITRADYRDHRMHLTADGDDRGRPFHHLQDDLGVAVHARVLQLTADKLFGLIDRQAAQRERADEWHQNGAIDADTHIQGVVRITEQTNADLIA